MKNILFICVENSCRSQIAEAFANIYGQGTVKAYSSGSKASGVVNPKAISSMKAAGYDLGTHHSKSLNQIPDIEYDYAIAMGCGDECPMIKSRHKEDWQIPDPKSMDQQAFSKVRDLIKAKVQELIAMI